MFFLLISNQIKHKSQTNKQTNKYNKSLSDLISYPNLIFPFQNYPNNKQYNLPKGSNPCKSFQHTITMKLLVTVLLVVLVIANPDWTQTQKVIQDGINEGVFSGGVLAVVTNNVTLLKKAYGTTTPRRGFYAPPMQVGYKFDINRLTQVVGINTVFMDLEAQVLLNTTKRIATSLTDFNNNGKGLITVEQMMLHNSGFPSDYNDPFPATPAALLKNIEGMKLDYTTETKYQYSEIGYTVLGHVIEKFTNKTLKDAMFQIMVIAGMRDTTYLPTTPKDQIVPGGWNKGICQGIPYNKYANFINKMTGNAGLFSTIDNMANYMQVMLNKGHLNLTKVFPQQIVTAYTTAIPKAKYNNTAARGWDTVPLTNPPCGKKFSQHSFGLADTSGSYIWADKEKNVAIVFLANGDFPIPRKSPPAEFQGRLSDAIMTALGY